jgi:hypothetical protein
VVETLRGSDFVCLVTEPTPFGINDLALACDLVRELGIPMGVVINRSDIGDERADEPVERLGQALQRYLRTAGLETEGPKESIAGSHKRSRDGREQSPLEQASSGQFHDAFPLPGRAQQRGIRAT